MSEQEVNKLFLIKYNSKIASTRGRVDKEGTPIEMKLTFEEFTNLYKDKGVLPMLPFVISRVNDIGHYESGNVFLSTNAQNALEAHDPVSEEGRIITLYSSITKYKRIVVRRRLAKGLLSWEEVESTVNSRIHEVFH